MDKARFKIPFALCSHNKTMGRDRGDCGYVFSSSHKSENTVRIDKKQFFGMKRSKNQAVNNISTNPSVTTNRICIG